MKIKIKRAKLVDLKRIIELETKQNLLHEEFDHKIYAADRDFSKKWIKFLKKEWNKSRHYLLVAVDGNKIIGFILGYIKDRPLRKIKKYGFIDEIFIEEKYRHKGIGTKLVGKLIDWFKIKRISYIEASVSFKNKESLEFHKKLGFEEYEKIMKKNI